MIYCYFKNVDFSAELSLPYPALTGVLTAIQFFRGNALLDMVKDAVHWRDKETVGGEVFFTNRSKIYVLLQNISNRPFVHERLVLS